MYSLLEKISSPYDLKSLKISELELLAGQIRKFMIENISHTGGHLASNLGVVELTIALHYVFNSPCDKLVWDVGHQSYVHKILTNRRDLFHTLRQYQGLSGFPKRSESNHDVFETGHSSTAISAALGIARARDIKAEDYHVIAIVGDGALTGGMAFEALNDAGRCNTNLMVILNDNEMSISKNVGALAEHLSKIRSSARYNQIKRFTETMLKKIPIAGRPIIHSVERLKKSFKYLLVPGVIFEEMGFTYLGPFDGHNISTLVNVLKYASKLHGPTFIHVVTQKGKGYPFAENNPEQFHGVSPFHPETGKIVSKSTPTYSCVFGKKLLELGQKDGRVVAVSAAMPESTGLMDFKKHFPDRFFDVGIAEQHAVTMAAGLAINGMKPYVAIYSTFLQRAYDQILHDVCIQNLPVVLIIDRAGLVGEDGETHQGVFDISYLRHIPNMTIMAPKDAEELRDMLEFSLNYNAPIAIRYPKGSCSDYQTYSESDDVLKWESLTNGDSCCILTFGRMLESSFKVREILLKEGISIEIVNARAIKPLDTNKLEVLMRKHSHWITLEDHVIHGGFGSAINEYLINGDSKNISIMNLGIPDRFIPHGSVDELLKSLSLDPVGVARKIRKFLSGFKERVNVKAY